MSPLAVRRYRADRLLREEFQALRERVIRTARGRLRALGMEIDGGDLEACYATAWQGLHAAMIDGQEVENPFGWLVLVTFRRAVEECRARNVRERQVAGSYPRDLDACMSPYMHELADQLDDRIRLAQLFEGLRGRLSSRERQAATLCYLQGLSRSEAAARMGMSEGRMRKLMEGRGARDPGVCGKLGALAETIESGGWCESQGSLMRALAFGMLDPEGERYQLALVHRSSCPACRAYVLSLRGLAAALPPVLLPSGPLVKLLGHARSATHVATTARGAAGRAVAGRVIGEGAGSGAVGVSGAAGGGWLLTSGTLSAKLAAACLVAIGIGGSCVVLDSGASHPHRDRSTRAHLPQHARRTDVAAGAAAVQAVVSPSSSARAVAAAPEPARAVMAGREFGPEHVLFAGQGSAGSRARDTERHDAPSAHMAGLSSPAGATGTTSTAPAPAGIVPQAAEREFAPG